MRFFLCIVLGFAGAGFGQGFPKDDWPEVLRSVSRFCLPGRNLRKALALISLGGLSYLSKRLLFSPDQTPHKLYWDNLGGRVGSPVLLIEVSRRRF